VSPDNRQGHGIVADRPGIPGSENRGLVRVGDVLDDQSHATGGIQAVPADDAAIRRHAGQRAHHAGRGRVAHVDDIQRIFDGAVVAARHVGARTDHDDIGDHGRRRQERDLARSGRIGDVEDHHAVVVGDVDMPVGQGESLARRVVVHTPGQQDRSAGVTDVDNAGVGVAVIEVEMVSFEFEALRCGGTAFDRPHVQEAGFVQPGAVVDAGRVGGGCSRNQATDEDGDGRQGTTQAHDNTSTQLSGTGIGHMAWP
jgi:hypothetical protein